MLRLLVALLIATASIASAQEVIYTDSTTTSTVDTTGDMTTTVISPPPSAISPNLSTGTGDICTVGVSGAIQSQVLGISAGATVRDINCERLKNAKVLFDMGMKVAAVSVMCQDKRVFDAMMDAGTPCPYDGLIGEAAKNAWEGDPTSAPGVEQQAMQENDKKKLMGLGGVLAVFALLLAL